MCNKINLPDNFFLTKIQKQYLYCDKKSKDPFIKKAKPKPKYKLAGNCILEHYFFHVLTTGKDACKEICTLEICLEDWNNRDDKFEMEDIGYCDLTKYERIEKPLLLKKIKDRKNGFPYVARLNDQKYNELLSLQKNLFKPYISKEIRDIISKGLSETVEGIRERLNV